MPLDVLGGDAEGVALMLLLLMMGAQAGGGFRSWGGCWGWLLLGVASAAAGRMVSGRASAAAVRMGFLGCPQRVALCVRFAAAAADILFIINNVKKLDKSEIIN